MNAGFSDSTIIRYQRKYQQIPAVCSVYNTKSAAGAPGGLACTYLANKEGGRVGTDVIELMYPLIHGVAMPKSKAPPSPERQELRQRMRDAVNTAQNSPNKSYISIYPRNGEPAQPSPRRVTVVNPPVKP